MTTTELQHRFNLEMEKYGITRPVYSTIVQDYINYAYQRYVTEKYDSIINPRESVEKTERISRILAPIIDTFTEIVTFTPITYFSLNGVSVNLPSDFQYLLSERAEMTVTDCDGESATVKAKVKPIKHNMVDANVDNPFRKPSSEYKEIWRLNDWDGAAVDEHSVDLLPPADGTITKYVCRYLKKLTPVDIDAGTTIEIDDSVHEEIATRAAHMYLREQPKVTQDEKENTTA